jgi:hypothetical protein
MDNEIFAIEKKWYVGTNYATKKCKKDWSKMDIQDKAQ